MDKIFKKDKTENHKKLKEASDKFQDCLSKRFIGDFFQKKDVNIEQVCALEYQNLRYWHSIVNPDLKLPQISKE